MGQSNLIDKDNLAEVTAVFDAAVITLNELAQEIVTIEAKYGTKSALLAAKKTQLAHLRNLYDKTLKYINYLRELNQSMYTEFMVAELMRVKEESGLPFEHIAHLAGMNPEPWRKMDEWDNILKRVATKLDIPIPQYLSPEESLEKLIETLKPSK